MDDLMVVSDPARVSALLHPLRTRILQAIDTGTMTPSEVARAIGEPASKVHYHMRILEKAGIVRLVERRRVGSITELYFQVTAKNFRVQMDAQAGGDQIKSLVDAQVKELSAQLRSFLSKRAEEQVERERGLFTVHTMRADSELPGLVTETVARLQERMEHVLKQYAGQRYKLVVGLIPIDEEER